jgi:hypothetical protein
MDPWTITNQGGAFTLGGLVDNGFYLSTDPVITNTDELIGENHNGQEITTAGGFFNWGGPTFAIGPHTPGVYYLGVLVDQTNQVLETNENNNYAKHGLIVLGPDETDSPWGPTERRMLSMQTGATYSLFTSPLGSAWNFTNPDRIYVAGTPQLGHVLITALVGGENIATGADASITSLLGPPDPVTGVSPAGPSILVN